MADAADIKAQLLENEAIIEELLNDGSDPDALYPIEHHFASESFEVLEKAAIELFKKGYEVTDAEQFELEDGSTIFAFDIIQEHELDLERINDETEAMFALADSVNIEYDGWGTYFMDESTSEQQDD